MNRDDLTAEDAMVLKAISAHTKEHGMDATCALLVDLVEGMTDTLNANIAAAGGVN